MSRESRDRRDEADAEAALLAAYIDGVAELSPEDRRRIETRLARDPDARADADAVRALLDRLRALPGHDGGTEPDWAAMERSIRHAVAAEPPRPWWRSWRWLAPAMTCATAAAVLAVIWPRAQMTSLPERPLAVPHDAPAAEPPRDDVVALWLDGNEVDVDLSASDAAGDLLGVPGEVPSPGDADEVAAGRLGDSDEVGLLPATDLAWVDHLDAAALERAERWLAGKNAGEKG